MNTQTNYLCLLAALLAGSLGAANYTVTTTNDTGPGSLRAILITANGAAGPHTIMFGNTGHFAGGGTINLVTPLPEIAQSVYIEGWRNEGITNNAISVVGSPFVFAAGTSNSLQQLNVEGSITGGQNISIANCVITNAGIWSTGVLQVATSSIVFSPGAGIWSSGNATLSGVHVSLCKAGGIHNEGFMAIQHSTIVSHTSPTSGGGIYNAGTGTVERCVIQRNTAMGVGGGGVYNEASLVLKTSTLSGNKSTGGYGAGILNWRGLVEVDRTLIAQNHALGGEGANGYGASGGRGGGFY